MTSYVHGEPTWQDQSSPDAAKAAEFYSALLGWQCPEGDPQMGGYRNCELAGKTVAGISPQMDTDPSPPHWTVYFNVDNADETAALVSEHGGQVLFAPMDVGPMGRMAIFMDPTGAAFGIWQPGLHKGAGARDQIGAACWHELLTTDVDAAKHFYGAVFGWQLETSANADAGGEYTQVGVGDKQVAGIMAKPSMMPAEVPSHWAVYFAVDDADAAVAKIRELGGQVMVGPETIEPGTFAVAADTTGATFNVIKVNPQYMG